MLKSTLKLIVRGFAVFFKLLYQNQAKCRGDFSGARAQIELSAPNYALSSCLELSAQYLMLYISATKVLYERSGQQA